MSTPLPSSIILASAGTGKTYQLASRYVALLNAGVDPARILATTFTRHAAGQIFDRVVARLLDAAEGAPDAASREVAKRSLSTLLHRLDRLAVSTLDSFFAKLASGYATELGLPPGWSIIDDDEDERLRAHAVEMAMEQGDRNDLLTLLRLMMAKRFSSSVAKDLLSKVKEAHSVFLAAPAQAWEVVDVPAGLRGLSETEWLHVQEGWDRVPLHKNADGSTTSKVWQGAHDATLAAATSGNWEAIVGKGLGEKILAGEEKFSKGPITPAVVAAYEPLLRHARHTLLSKHVEGTLALRDLLERFDLAYTQLKRKRRAYRFDDVPRELLKAHASITLEEIAFRLDGRTDHVLLDEFQDTSSTQFALLEPLIEEMLSGGGGLGEDASARSVLCVGDLKQSLYQWRDAEPGLFAALPKRWPQLERSELHTSYRSSPIVLDAVNRVFENIAGNSVLQEYRDAAQAWQEGFTRHEAAPKVQALPGFVRLTVAPAGGADMTLRAAARRVADLVSTFPQVSVGVLVRAKKGIPRLIYELGRLGVAASEEGGNPLTDSPAVAAALSALQLADHPGDTAAAFHLATTPLGAVLGLPAWDNGSARQNVATRIREEAMSGFAPLLLRWLEALTPSCDARDVRRLEQLVTLAEAFDARHDSRAEHFVAMARTRRVDDPTAHPVRVMTIHSSKGLEFDQVVLPDLDGKLGSRSPGILWRREDPFAPIDTVTRYANKAVQSLDPRLAELARLHQGKVISESLSVLYVALTRARHALELVVAPDKPGVKSVACTFAHVLREALAPGEAASPGILFEMGREDWPTAVPPVAQVPMAAPLAISLAPGRSPARLGRERPPSRRGHATRNAQAADRGTLLHALAQRVGWLEDGVPGDEAFLSVARSLRLVPGLDVAGEIAGFRSMLQEPAIAASLTRGRYTALGFGTKLDLRREVPFAFRHESGSWAKVITGRIDRLVLGLGADGRPAHAEVLDFKSDAMGPGEDLIALGERHRSQMELYRVAAARLTGIPVERVRVALVLLSARQVLNMEPNLRRSSDGPIITP